MWSNAKTDSRRAMQIPSHWLKTSIKLTSEMILSIDQKWGTKSR